MAPHPPREDDRAAPPLSLPLPAGYELEEILSQRDACAVLRARHGGRAVVLRLESGPGREARAELAVLAALEHPELAVPDDHGALPGGGWYSARPWIEAADLRTWSADRSPEEIGAAVARLTLPLAHLHRAGFVHGDLKAENALVTETGKVVLCDLGLARTSGRPAPGDEEQGVTGTLFAIAPELLLGLPATVASDLFALGALLVRLLVGHRRGAREFYAAFPRRSFLDAAGIAPEDLPAWARDLVVALTAREPERRPGNALEVGRTLAARLDIALPAAAAEPLLRWRAIQGREGWVRSWVRDLDAERSAPRQWLQLPADEDPRGLWEDLRLRLALAGRVHRGLDLTPEVVERAATDLDRWAKDEARGDGPLLVHLPHPGPTARRVVDVLANAMARRTADTTPPALIACTNGDAELASAAWTVLAVPSPDHAAVTRGLGRLLPDVADEERAQLARILHEGAAGSASRLDRMLRRAQQDGVLHWDGAGMRLRSGALAAFAAAGQSSSASPITSASRSDDAARLLAALDAGGGRLSGGELEAIAELPAERFARGLLELEREDAIVRQQAADAALLCRTGTAASLVADEGLARHFHARLARLREENGAPPHRFLPHLLGANPSRAVLDQWRGVVEDLRESGRAELALEVAQRTDNIARRLGTDVPAELPEVTAEIAGSWCQLSQPDQALRVLEELPREPRSEALRLLVRARVAVLRHRSDEALDLYEQSGALDPRARAEAQRLRAQLLYTLGRDEEVVALVESLAAEDPPGGGLPARRWVHARSLAAMSALRLGRVEESRAELTLLLGETLELGDPALEIALRIDVATVERRSGSATRARDYLERALQLADRHGLSAAAAQVRETLGSVLRDEAEMAQAGDHLHRSLASRERLGDGEGAARVRGVLGLLWCERGHAHAARRTIDECLDHLGPAWKRRYAPLLLARRAEMGARLGREEVEGESLTTDEESDPRILSSLARAAWIRGRRAAAREYAERAEGLAGSLRQSRMVVEAQLLRRWIEGEFDATPSAEPGPLLADDLACLAVLRETGEGFDEERTTALAERLEAAGRDDRAARLRLALAGRIVDEARSREHLARADDLLATCTAGASAQEAAAYRRLLLGMPDPWPGDLLDPVRRTPDDALLSEDVTTLLEINRRLLAQQDSHGLLGAIVESAVAIAGAERGFFVLEEHGVLRFDIALDSSRGGIDAPELEVSGTIVEEALRAMAPVRVSNAVDDDLHGHASSVVSLELRSVLCVPVEITTDLRGAIYVDHRLRTGAFDARAERLCMVLASQAALAIHQVRRLEEIRRLNRRLERQVRERDSDLRSARLALAEAHVEQGESRLIGGSATMHRIRNVLRRCAASDLAVLVVGESGTGKELAARTLHELSQRREGAFVSENCAALPASLIESELFGYVKGAFTGADRDRTGLIEQANGGTLFLDEIGEIPVDLQAKLLRVLETSEIRPVGGDSTRRIEFRLVAATNRDLEREVREGRFRSDLYYRLDGLRVTMPSLAQHPEDIPELVEHFLVEEEKRGQPRRRITPHVLQRLATRAWPGNVRELRNEISRLCVLSEGDLDDPDLLRPASAIDPVPAGDEGKFPTLEELERRAIGAALERTGGDKRKAAALLGISRAKIYQRLKDWREQDEREDERV